MTREGATGTVTLPLHVKRHPALPPTIQPRHYLYIRPHARNSTSTDSTSAAQQENALYISNIPFDTTVSHIHALFASQILGNVRISSVDFEDSRPTKKGKDPLSLLRKGKSKKRKRGNTADGEEEAELDPGWPDTWSRELHVSGSCAVVNFVDETSRDVAWKAVKKLVKASAKDESVLPTWSSSGVEFGQQSQTGAKPPKAKNAPPPLGSARYLAHQRLRFPPKDLLQSKTDDYLAAFASLEAANNAKRAALRSQPDADGFVTVTKGARTGPVRMEEVQEMEERRKKKLAKSKEQWGEGAFYRFQIREKGRLGRGSCRKGLGGMCKR